MKFILKKYSFICLLLLIILAKCTSNYITVVNDKKVKYAAWYYIKKEGVLLNLQQAYQFSKEDVGDKYSIILWYDYLGKKKKSIVFQTKVHRDKVFFSLQEKLLDLKKNKRNNKKTTK